VHPEFATDRQMSLNSGSVGLLSDHHMVNWYRMAVHCAVDDVAGTDALCIG
jgi:hypothetical protein